jgi:hypothetical protein
VSDTHNDGRRPENRLAKDEDIILEIVEMLKALDDTRPDQMTPLFYQHWFEQLNMSIRDLLSILGREADI